MSKLVSPVDQIAQKLAGLGCEANPAGIRQFLIDRGVDASAVDDDLLFEMADVLSGGNDASQIVKNQPAKPVVKSTKRSKTRAVQQQLADVGNQQVEAAIEQVRQIVQPSAAVVAELYAATPYLIQAEAMAQVDAQMPLIEQDNQQLIAQAAACGQQAIAKSRQAATDFLAEYGL